MAETENVEKIEEILLREIATILSMDEEEITPTTPLASVGMDSIRFVEVLLLIEREFDVELIKSQLSRDDVKDIASLARSIYAAKQQ
ncbi:MAG: acyl carrier protein [Planctomycetes bacterium]|nr:acyl carrier protein [Planctomycetota bacterium]